MLKHMPDHKDDRKYNDVARHGAQQVEDAADDAARQHHDHQTGIDRTSPKNEVMLYKEATPPMTCPECWDWSGPG
jgi:hypothetical protein